MIHATKRQPTIARLKASDAFSASGAQTTAAASVDERRRTSVESLIAANVEFFAFVRSRCKQRKLENARCRGFFAFHNFDSEYQGA